MMGQTEIWRSVVGYEELYEVSSLGNIRSKDCIVTRGNGRQMKIAGKMLNPMVNEKGYLYVTIKGHKKKVHRLVAEAFIPRMDESTDTVNHKNEDKTDNRVENLEWLTNGDNVRYSQLGPKSVRSRRILCTTTNDEFGCISDMARAYGWNPVYLCNTVSSGRTSYKGYEFKLRD